MVRRIGIILGLSFCVSLFHGLTNGIPDSFTTGVNRATLSDSVDYLLHLSSVNMDRYPEHAFTNASVASQICSKNGWDEKKALACKFMGEAKLELEDYYQAEKYLSDALSYFTEETPKILGDIYYLLAKTEYYLAEYQEANLHYRSAIDLFQKTNNHRKIANAYQNIGLIYHELDDLENATLYYKKSLAINEVIENDTNTAGLYQNLGIIYYNNDDFETALDYYEKSVHIYRELADTQNIATTFSNIGLIQLKQMNYEEAYDNFKRSYELFLQTNFRLGQMWALHNMGSARLWQRKFDQAEEYYNKSLEQARELHIPEGILSNLDALTELNAQLGKFEEAYYYQQDYTHMRDSIKALESKEKIAELETLYQLQAQEEKLNESLTTIKRHKTQRIGLIVILIIITVAAFLIYLAYRKKKNAEVAIYSRKLDLENVLVEKDKELELQKMELQIAEESDKLKSAFLANMSHELRTPMNAIIAFSNFLREPDLPETKKEEYLDHITSAGESLLRLIDDIIDIAKLESKQLKISIGPVNISRMLRELKKLFAKLKIKNDYPANLVLSVDPYHDYIVNTDVLRLKQILSNLIENAFKYTQRGVIEFGVENTTEGLLFFVRDTGIGIAKEKQEKIFDRFSQLESELNRRYGGTGLGLAISRNLTELLGGKIWVESEPGKGSTFFIRIPANDFRMVEIAYDPANAAKLIKGNEYNWKEKTILVAEDEELNFKVLNSCLSKTRAKILRAADGESAVNICKKHKIDLVLMDIQMPIMDGYEATLRIKAINKNIPIIAQTSFAMSNEKEKCLEAGCDDYISKPLDLERLLSIIDRLIHQKSPNA